MAVYAVGDIQGCYDPLMRVLERVGFDPASDTLWCAGDLVNRGPNSLETLRFLKGLGDSALCILGNHDFHLLECVAGARQYSQDTFDAVLAADDCDELVEWLRFRPMLHHDEELGFCMVHAGLPPAWSLKKAKRRAAKVEEALRGEDWQKFCMKVHTGKFPPAEPQSGRMAKLLFTTAVMTRVRYCTPDGTMDWGIRSGVAGQGEDAWFAHNKLAWRGKARIVYGHWASNGLVVNQKHVLGLDSGCVWGGGLTVARLDCEGLELVQEPCPAFQQIGGD